MAQFISAEHLTGICHRPAEDRAVYLIYAQSLNPLIFSQRTGIMTSFRVVLFIFSFCGTFISCCSATRPSLGIEQSAAQRRPNLILIMADDLGAKELSCYGHPKHHTPHLDQLARTGVQFNTCYTACICHPTRFEIMTGQYGSTNGVCQFAGRPGGPDPNSPEEQIVNHLTFGKVLQASWLRDGAVRQVAAHGQSPDARARMWF